MENKKQFTGVWIPIEIFRDDRINAVQKLLLSEIRAFSLMDASYLKSNRTIADEMNVSEVTVTRSITKLKELGIIDVDHKKGRVRVIKLTSVPSQIDEAAYKLLTRQGSQNDDINKQYKGTVKRTIKREGKKCTLEEAKEYFVSKGNSDLEAEKFYDYYEANGWVQGAGKKKIKNWKAAANNWMRNQSKYTTKNEGFNQTNYDLGKLKRFVAEG